MACSTGLLTTDISYSSCVVGWFFPKYALPNVVAFSFSSFFSLKLTYTKGKHPGIKLYRVQISAFLLSFPVGMLGKVDLVPLSAPIFGISILEKDCSAARLSFISHPSKSIGAVAWICVSNQWCINTSYAVDELLCSLKGTWEWIVEVRLLGAPSLALLKADMAVYHTVIQSVAEFGEEWGLASFPAASIRTAERGRSWGMCWTWKLAVFLPESVWQWTDAQMPVSAENSSLGLWETERAFQYVSLGLGVQEFMDFSAASSSLVGLHVQSSTSSVWARFFSCKGQISASGPYHRIPEWFGVERTVKPTPCHGQSCHPPTQAAQGPVQPGLEHHCLTTAWLNNFLLMGGCCTCTLKQNCVWCILWLLHYNQVES